MPAPGTAHSTEAARVLDCAQWPDATLACSHTTSGLPVAGVGSGVVVRSECSQAEWVEQAQQAGAILRESQDQATALGLLKC